jgi:hypothetical protein
MRFQEREKIIHTMKTRKAIRCPVCGEQLSPFHRTHIREKHAEYFHEVGKWQRAFIMSCISVFALLALNFLNNFLYSNIFLGLLFLVGRLIVLPFFFFTLLKLRSVAKKYGVLWRKTLSLSPPPIYYRKLVIRAIARATGQSEKEIEEKMRKNIHQD